MNRFPVQIFALAAALLLAVASAPALAQSQQTTQQADTGLGVKGIGARIGFVDPEDASGTAALGVHMDAGTFVRGVHLMPYVEYWSAGASIGGYNVDLSDLTFAADINMDFPLSGSSLTPYLGGGLGLHILSQDSNVPGVSTEDESKFGFNIQGGMRNQVMPNLSLFGEARYSFVSDMNQLKLMGGFTYQFIY
jgi:opacity protein-like surface antigen